MKIRNGFISNSSSSSFIVAFPRVPQSKEEVQEALFGDETTYNSPWEWDDESWPTKEVAETVWCGIKEPLDRKEVTSVIQSGYYVGHPDVSTFRDEETNKVNWEEYDRISRQSAEQVCDEFLELTKGCSLFCFKYSDNEGPYESALEHGDLFSKLRHLRISHH